MRSKTRLVILALVAVAAGLWSIAGCGSKEQVNLVPAWALTSEKVYDAESMLDPVASWAPDSKSLIFTAIDNQARNSSVFQWNVGDKRITRILLGVCASYMDNDNIIFFRRNPMSIYQRDLRTGREKKLPTDLHNVEAWREITGFSYDPAHKTIDLRFSNFTRYYEQGCQAMDLSGKVIGNICRQAGDDVLDRSLDPKGQRSAAIVGDLTADTQALRISPVGKEDKGKLIAAGKLGAVAWSPDGRVVAFAENDKVNTVNPTDGSIVTVANFGEPVDPESTRGVPRVCRLNWSPDSNYLLATEVVPSGDQVFQMMYVLDMSKVGR